VIQLCRHYGFALKSSRECRVFAQMGVDDFHGDHSLET
jgi:hypothetical protein